MWPSCHIVIYEGGLYNHPFIVRDQITCAELRDGESLVLNYVKKITCAELCKSYSLVLNYVPAKCAELAVSALNRDVLN